MQAAAEEHETPLSPSPRPGTLALGTIDHRAPSQDSTSVLERLRYCRSCKNRPQNSHGLRNNSRRRAGCSRRKAPRLGSTQPTTLCRPRIR